MQETGHQLMTFAEVFRLLHVSRSTANRMRREDDFPPSVQVGRRKRWRRHDVDKWLEGQREGFQWSI